MMRTDAVLRLCKLLGIEPPNDYGKEVEDMLDAAADEIERLRAALGQSVGNKAD